MARKKIVAGNWKMNLDLAEGKALVAQLLAKDIQVKPNTEVVLAPSFVMLGAVGDAIANTNGFYLAAQNCNAAESGAFTGEVSVRMLKSVGATYVILGHSERRQYNHETDAILAAKVNTALANGLKVIFCCGEPLEIREADTHNTFINAQLENGLFHLTAAQMADVVIAYEPIWAIGTGKTASAAQAQDMHANIRATLTAKYGATIADQTSILYGGSCNAGNAVELFGQPDIDGGLIGGAALKADDFAAIIAAM